MAHRKRKSGSSALKEPSALSPSLCGSLAVSAQEQQMSLATISFYRHVCWKLMVLRAGAGQAGGQSKLVGSEISFYLSVHTSHKFSEP